MTGINCANLLAFIQIAVAFDFGLLWLKDSHIFCQMHSSLKRECNKFVATTLTSAHQIYERLEGNSDTEARIQRARVKGNIDKLESLVNAETNWGKYAYLGLYSGIYGLLCLFIIGLFGCKYDSYGKDFLLIFGEILCIIEFFTLFQLSNMGRSSASHFKILNKIAKLFGIILITSVFIYLDWIFRPFPNFEVPFIPIAVIVVYLPIIVYVFRNLKIWVVYLKINSRTKSNIEKAQRIFQNAPIIID